MYQIMYSQTLVGKWYDSDFIKSHDPDIPNVVHVIHSPRCRIMCQQRSVHIGDCNEILNYNGQGSRERVATISISNG